MSIVNEALRLMRIGSLDKAKKLLIGFGIPAPSATAKWSNEIGQQLLLCNQSPSENLDYIRFITITAELYDHFNAPSLVTKCLQSRQLQHDIDRDLKLAKDTSLLHYDTNETGWRLLRQKLYFWLQVARLAYRENDYPCARQLVQQCLNIAQHKLSPIPHGLVTDLKYALASIARQESKLDEAIRCYQECLADALERLKRKSGETELKATKYLVGKVFALCLSYCFIEKGMLREAQTLITAGEILLWDTEDLLNRQYCKLLNARILRHMAGRDPRKRELLSEARESLKQCIEICQNYKPKFAYRAYYELGFVELYSEQFEEAKSNFEKVLKVTNCDKDSRWKANGLIALSRLHFHQSNFKESLEIAIEAEALAKQAKQKWAVARAILMQARAELSLSISPETPTEQKKDLWQSAKGNLQHVIAMTELSNPAVRALPLILLTRLHLYEGNVAEAQSFFKTWEAIKGQVQYAAILSLAKQVEQELAPKDAEVDFIIKKDIPAEQLSKNKLLAGC